MFTGALSVSLLAAFAGCGAIVDDGGAGPGSASNADSVTPDAATTLVYGANHDYYLDFVAAIPAGTHGYRVYRDAIIQTPADVPMHWPDELPTPYSTLSLRPMPGPLLDGSLDKALNLLMDSAPDHAELTIWHEAGPGNPLNYPSYITADSMTKMHAHMQALVTAHGHVKYGSIITGPANQRVDWLGQGLDWYGVDIYDNSNFENCTPMAPATDCTGNLDHDAIVHRMDENKAAWASVANGTPSIRITETNSHDDSHRKNWYLWLSQWMVANNGFRMLTYWNPDGALSGPWPPSQTVIDYWNQVLEPTYGRP